MALEVGGPEIVGLRRGRGNDAGMLIVAPTAAFLNQPTASEEIARRADGGEVQGGMPRPEPIQELGGAPGRVLPTGRAEQGRELRGDAVRAVMRGPAAILQAAPPCILEAAEPLVASLPTDAVPRAELGHRVQVQSVITNEALSLFHG